MKTAPAIALLSAGLAVSAAGCASSAENGPQGPTPAVSTQEMNQAKMHDALVPQAVQTAFARDYPNAAIDTVRMHASSTGQNFYEVTYIRDGQSSVTRYFASGTHVPGS